MKHKKTSLAIAAILAVGTQFAGAIPTLYISDGTVPGTITVLDGGFGDSLAATPGAVLYAGGVGTNWVLTISTGLSKPVVGSGTSPELSLDVSAVSIGAGTVTIWWSDDDFGPLGNAHFVVGSSVSSLATGGSVTWSTYGDSGNAINGNDGALAQSTLMSSMAVAAALNPAPQGGPEPFSYSLTAKIVITHGTGGGTSNPDMALTSVPDGGTTLALLGCSMLGLGGLRRKFSKG